jgi:hypothetical protein
MRETRRYNIANRVFTKTDIMNIGKVFLDEYKSAQDAGHHSTVTFRISCTDNTSYESEDMGLFDEGSVVDLKRTISIGIAFDDYKLARGMYITLFNGGGYDDCLAVKGDDQNWVNGVFIKIKEIVDSTKPQDNWIIRHRTFLLHLNALGIGIIVWSVLDFLLDSFVKPIENPSDTVKSMRAFFKTYPLCSVLFVWFLRWLPGIPYAYWIRDWLLKLWPPIEFDFGPEHLKVEKMRRFRISVVVSTIVIPLILAIVYDFVKGKFW